MEQSVTISAAKRTRKMGAFRQNSPNGRSSGRPQATWSLRSMMTLTTAAVLLATNCLSSLPRLVSASDLSSASQSAGEPLIPFLQTKPPHVSASSFSTHLVHELKRKQQLSLQQQRQRQQEVPKKGAKHKAAYRGNVRRRSRAKARSPQINRALRRHHHTRTHHAAMAEKDEGEEHTLFPMESGEEHTTMPGIVSQDDDDDMVMMMMGDGHYHDDYNETEHGDGLDHHHHKHHHKNQHQHHHKHNQHPHPGEARKHKESKAKAVKYKGYSSQAEAGTGSYYYPKGSSKSAKKGAYLYEDYDHQEEAESYEYRYGTSKSKTKSKSKSKHVHRGKRSKRRYSSDGGLRYFDASVLLEMQDHYVSELSYLDLRQLETAVMETYNHLSETNCDLQARELVAVTMDPTPTSTGYILHMQGQCYNCDPSNVRVFAHDEQVFDGGMMTMDGKPQMPMMPDTTPPTFDGTDGGDTMTTVPPASNGTLTTPGGGSSGSGGQPDTGANGTMTVGTGDAAGGGGGVPAGQDANATMAGGGAVMDTMPADAGANAGANATGAGGRNRGGFISSLGGSGFASHGAGTASGFATSVRLPKKRKTLSKQRSRLVRSEDEAPEYLEDALPDFNYGTTEELRAAYFHNEQNRRHLNHHQRANHHHHNHNHHHHQHQEAVNQEAVNRDPEIPTQQYEEELEEEDRAMHYVDHQDDPNLGLIMPYYKSSKKSKVVRYGRKGSKASKSGKGTYHSLRDCDNPDASRRAPTEEQFVVALNDVTDKLLAQYNKLSVRSAVQVQAEPCSATEEEFDSALVMQFKGPEGDPQSLTPEEIQIVEQTIVHSYNHLQATHSCDVPYFREMTELMLRGIAQGPSEDTFLAMFEAKGTCRGDGCSEDATFFDPRDEEDDRNRRLGQVRMPSGGFNSILTRDGHPVTYSEGEAHVYQEQCYCPFKVDEFGPPFISDMETVLNQILHDAYSDGVVESIVSVVDIIEVAGEDDEDVAFDTTPAPGPGTEDVESFIILQFFGQRDLVTEREVNEIEASMPLIYRNLQSNAYCDPLLRTLETAELRTVDPGPTADSFLLGFALDGSCDVEDCGDFQQFFAPPGQDFVACGTDKVQGAPLIDDFENDLFQSILMLRETGDVVNIQASGDAVEVLPGATPAPILEGRSANVPAPAPKPTFSGRSSSFTARNGVAPTPASPVASQHPTHWPTWLETWYPTYTMEGYDGGRDRDRK